MDFRVRASVWVNERWSRVAAVGPTGATGGTRGAHGGTRCKQKVSFDGKRLTVHGVIIMIYVANAYCITTVQTVCILFVVCSNV